MARSNHPTAGMQLSLNEAWCGLVAEPAYGLVQANVTVDPCHRLDLKLEVQRIRNVVVVICLSWNFILGYNALMLPDDLRTSMHSLS